MKFLTIIFALLLLPLATISQTYITNHHVILPKEGKPKFESTQVVYEFTPEMVYYSDYTTNFQNEPVMPIEDMTELTKGTEYLFTGFDVGSMLVYLDEKGVKYIRIVTSKGVIYSFRTKKDAITKYEHYFSRQLVNHVSNK